MATISSPGIGSGLDIKSIVSQLVAIEKQPLTQLQVRAATGMCRSTTRTPGSSAGQRRASAAKLCPCLHQSHHGRGTAGAGD